MVKIVYLSSNENDSFCCDLASLMEQPDHESTLFLFNDCIEYHHSNKKGSGNASIREWNQYNKNLKIPRSIGIPVGSIKTGGFKYLSDESKKYIDNAFLEINNLLENYHYSTIVYPAQKNGRFLIDNFYVSTDVIDYIMQKIEMISQES